MYLPVKMSINFRLFSWHIFAFPGSEFWGKKKISTSQLLLTAHWKGTGFAISKKSFIFAHFLWSLKNIMAIQCQKVSPLLAVVIASQLTCSPDSAQIGPNRRSRPADKVLFPGSWGLSLIRRDHAGRGEARFFSHFLPTPPPRPKRS